jgi:fungal STAND N-terminal Goodbye domain
MADEQSFEELWESAIEKYIDATNRTLAEQEFLKKLKSPSELENDLITRHKTFSDYRAKHGKLVRTLKNVVKPVTALSSVASSAISLTPFGPASAIFGAVTFLITATENVSSAYDWIDQLFDKLGDFTVRLEEYCKGGLTKRLGNRAVEILICLLELLGRSEKTIKTGRWKKYAAVVFLGKDEEIKASFDKLAKLLEDEQRLVIAITYATNQRMDKRIEELQETVKKTFEAVKQDQNDKSRDKIADWISTTDYPLQQSDIINRREEGTGKWFLNSNEFNEWCQDGSNKTLFCPGIPGSGKTVISAIAINHLAKQPSDIGLAYIFCNYKSTKQSSASDMLAAILKQLVRSRPKIPEPILKLYEQHKSRQSGPTVDEIPIACFAAIKEFKRVYIVIDALDEFSDREGQRSRLLKKLRSFQANSELRLMATSRFDPEIEAVFKGDPLLEIRASDEDVKRYVASQIHRLPSFAQDDHGLQSLIENGISNGVDGMYVSHLYQTDADPQVSACTLTA